jgi:hypothetical protein
LSQALQSQEAATAAAIQATTSTAVSVVSRACAEPNLKAGRLRGPRVVVEEPTETLPPTNATDAPFHGRALNQFVAQSLVIPFAMIVSDELGHSTTEMTLTERNQPI